MEKSIVKIEHSNEFKAEDSHLKAFSNQYPKVPSHFLEL